MNASPSAQPVPAAFRRLYRCHVQPPHDWRQPELTAFVEAGTHSAAVRKIAAAIAALEYRKPEEVQEHLYNCTSAEELIEQGLGEDIEGRLLETAWGGGKPICFVEHPLVLLADPAPLLRVWARVAKPVTP